MFVADIFYLFGLNGVQYESYHIDQDSIFFTASITKNECKCKHCLSKNITFKGAKIREFKMVPFARKKTYLKLTLHKIYCLDCNKYCWPELDFASGKQRMINAFVQYVLDLLALGTILSVAQFLNVGWDLVKNIHKKYLKKKYKTIPYKNLKYLSIDEFSIKKGHTYMTIFVNIETGRIIYAIEGRRREDILPFLQKLAKKATSLKAIAMDMSLPYYSAVQEALPNTDIVFDHFHVNVHINKALDEIRKQQQNKTTKESKKAIKGQRFLLLKNYADLDENSQNRLKMLLEVNEPLMIAHSMKEQFRLFWEQPTIEAAAKFFLRWFWDIHTSTIKPMIKVANTLLRYSQGLMNYFKHWITNGKTEGINNKIKTMKRQAYGFRDMQYFKLRLYHLHEQKNQLTG